MKLTTILIAMLISVNCFGKDLHDEIIKVYNFSPHTMTSAEQQAVYPKLEEFFNMVVKDKDAYIESLRAELVRNDNNPYFYFDGGILLTEISKSESDLQLVADAMMKVDIRDIGSLMYMEYLLNLSEKGANVINAAMKVLDDSSFVVFSPKHALELKYGEVLKYILPRYSKDLYLAKLITMFNKTNSVENKITFLDLFIYANCCEADEFLQAIKKDLSQPQKLREQIESNEKLTTVTQSEDAVQYSNAYNQRKAKLTRISDEAIEDLNTLTLEMRKYYKCNK